MNSEGTNFNFAFGILLL